MTFALHLRADFYDPYHSPAYVFPMNKERAEHLKAGHDKFCDNQFFNEVLRDSAKDIFTVVQIKSMEDNHENN